MVLLNRIVHASIHIDTYMAAHEVANENSLAATPGVDCGVAIDCLWRYL